MNKFSNLSLLFFTTLLILPLNVNSASIDIIAVSPRMVDISPDDIFDEVSTGNFVVGLGEKVYLQIVPQPGRELTNVQWSVIDAPANAEEQPVVIEGIATFRPLMQGSYTLQATATENGNEVQLTQTILVANYVGGGALAGDLPECSLCHTDLTQEWLTTAHSQVFKTYIDGERDLPPSGYQPEFLKGHTLGFNQNPLANNRGFDDAAREAGADLSEIADMINQAFVLVHDNDPSNDPNFFESLPQSVRGKTSVQCESCHGPGSQHFGNQGTIAIPWDGGACTTCHDDMSPVKPLAQNNSAHNQVIALFERDPFLMRSECAKCHTTQGFNFLALEDHPEALEEFTDPHGITCTACHDPHEKANPQQLRVVGEVTLESGHVFEDAGRAAACAMCHQSRIGESLEEFIASDRFGPHFGPQTDVYLGINAWDFGVPFAATESIHKMLIKDTCVTCHMAEVPANGWTQEEGTLVGAHSFKVVNRRGTESSEDDIENLRNSCLPCHLTITSVDRITNDYDGDGIAEGMQTEVKGLLEQIVALLQASYPQLSVNHSGEITGVTPGIFNRMTFEEKAALHNYKLILLDGSFGIHNPIFTVEVLQRSITALSNQG